MQENIQIIYEQIEENKKYEEVICRVLSECFKEENLENKQIYISVTLTNPETIWKLNKQYRNVDRPTDVLSFPMFERNEINNLKNDILGDIVISIEQVKNQAIEYGHSFERELSYMTVHGFYHLMGYDHIEENDKLEMRNKEEIILKKIGMER